MRCGGGQEEGDGGEEKRGGGTERGSPRLGEIAQRVVLALLSCGAAADRVALG